MKIRDFFKWFSSGPDAAEKVLDAGIRGIDALVFTDEEKAEFSKKLADQWIELQKLLGEETTVRAVSRRVLAVLTMVPFVGLTVGTAIAYPFDKEYANFLLVLANGQFGWMALGVMAFYFGPYMFQRMMNGNGKK